MDGWENSPLIHSRFDPRGDGFSCPADLIGAEETEQLQQAQAAALEKAVLALRADFSGMIDVYGLPRRMRFWLHNSHPQGWLATADALGARAYYLARRPPVRGSVDSAGRDFLRRLWLEAMTASSARLIQWRSILYGLPEQWLPALSVTRDLRQRLTARGDFFLEDLQLDLRLPSPGGRAWLKAQSVREWYRLREQLKAGRPCVVELIREQECPDFQARETLVVFAAREASVAMVLLYCYDPSRGARPLLLHMDLSAEELVVRESEDLGKTSLRGLFLVDAPADAPPESRRRRLLRSLGMARLHWWWRRRRSFRSAGADPSRHAEPRGDKLGEI
ncbi:hypothetical protein [Geoalkalibacter halelectricus]|uniref:BioF2-like acetyltransferase domain-containing protein n=1 Tax=Geoalkalibacter halelectricus TaxID=2847045 RepID=A0ABY5ZM06_9BACT|nr:hypothetical protein [Geoalkalibacter halelectricus]MDO3378525.1 hypothetical protein [Geoalkalibacter halelectricus]UWZ80161.1 hypothetical protein L9S41_01900 [Geoalkalibacter halelectricus]